MGHAPTLFFIKMTGCPHCEEAEPEVRKLARANPGLKVVTKDLTKDSVPFPVPYVPAYAFVRPDGQAFKVEPGDLPDAKATTLAGWVRDVMAGRRPRK